MMMDLEQVRALAQILTEHDLSVLELSSGEDRIKLERRPAAVPMQPVPVQSPAAQGTCTQEQAVQNGTEIQSPMVGVFYAAPSPDAEPFVKVGSHVKKGDVLCVIEAMKLMNEVNAEQDGTIQKICVQNEEVVEYGQTLFFIE
ncbi:MAG: acetyl-CoA carboxylase biotin carboxyl carrier protein [Oscillospiraceae bacterium]|jgi:acetyl-CoA carboxylase biotin carboxyl carrier protein|nr:acetyl-CoA carboxylase biotin carboxyl carrier protein [Oscillospiraceae bacterium]